MKKEIQTSRYQLGTSLVLATKHNLLNYFHSILKMTRFICYNLLSTIIKMMLLMKLANNYQALCA